MDREKGQVLSATQYGRNTTTGVDLQTGRLIHIEEKTPRMGKVVRDVQPFAPGAKDWQPMAWSPRTGCCYLAIQNLSMDYEGIEANYIAGTPYVGVDTKYYPGPGGNRGFFAAWYVLKKEKRWEVKEDLPV